MGRCKKNEVGHLGIRISLTEGAIGLSIELTLKPAKQRYGIFPSAEAAIAAAVHTSACEGRTVPANEVEGLWKMVRGEISRQDLIKKYVAEALVKQEARDPCLRLRSIYFDL